METEVQSGFSLLGILSLAFILDWILGAEILHNSDSLREFHGSEGTWFQNNTDTAPSLIFLILNNLIDWELPLFNVDLRPTLNLYRVREGTGDVILSFTLRLLHFRDLWPGPGDLDPRQWRSALVTLVTSRARAGHL